MTDSIIVFGRVCPSISSRQEVYQYNDRVILYRRPVPRFEGQFRAIIYAEPIGKNETETVKKQPALAYTGGESYEDALRALAARLHQLADELVKEPPAL